jgi:dihydrofolate reductase
MISIVVAMADNGLIGRAGGLPWKLSADLRHFRAVTLGKPVIMGRRTWQSIGRPLPSRQNIVISRDAAFRASGATVVDSPETALRAAEPAAEVMVIGGAEIYRAFLGQARRIYLTEVHGPVAGDTFFPDWSRAEWVEQSRENHPATLDAPAYSFVLLERRAP